MDTVFDLVRKLALLSIFAAFFELLLPKGSYRAYTRMVVGLLVIAMLLQPVLELRGESLNLEGLLAAANLGASTGELQQWTWVREQSQNLMEAQLAEQAWELLSQDYPGHELEVDLDLGFDEYGNMTEFRGMEVSLRPCPSGIIPVRPVTVGQEKKERVAADQGVVTALAQHLGVAADTLSIWVYTGGR